MLICALELGDFTADLLEQSFLPNPCENNMNQALKSRPRLVRISYSRPCFFDILVNTQACIGDQTARQESRGNALGNQHERAGEGGKIFTMYKEGKVCQEIQASPFEVWSKAAS